jgi:small subunit ribosomal protein S18
MTGFLFKNQEIFMADDYKEKFDEEGFDKKDIDSYEDDVKMGAGKGKPKTLFKRKICKFCSQKSNADYKNYDMLRRFITERGKILPRRITGTCSKHQRSLTTAIKRARVLAYLPFVKK